MPQDPSKKLNASRARKRDAFKQDFTFLMQSMTDSMAAFGKVIEEKDTAKRAEILDRLFHANLGMMSTGLSPAALMVAYTDWWAHIVMAPNKQLELMENAGKKLTNLYKNISEYVLAQDTSCFDTKDKRFHERFKHEAWHEFPYCAIAQSFLMLEDWWQEATQIRGLEQNHENLVSFMRLQWLNALSPENNPMLNPAALEKAIQSDGRSCIQGVLNWAEDVSRFMHGEKPVGTEDYVVGKDVAVTKGHVIYRNELIELIQYSSQTETVFPEPILIIPAWIMKYYILDLSPENSMVDYLVKKGHTVFMVSWKNPDASYSDYGMIDYMKQGILKALDAVKTITEQEQVHATGYCIGGTLLTMAASYLCRQNQSCFKTLTLFAAQTDFDEPGELMTFIDENQLCYLEDIMYSQGYLRGDQMSSTFDLLRPQELIWSKAVKRYLLGEDSSINDLIAWNEDTTRLPYKMHSEYLRHFHLHNDLAEGDYLIDGEPVTLEDIKSPLFVVGTEKDHIAPWKSIYKIHLYTKSADVTFVLANKGHNGGIVSEPGHKGRTYRLGKTSSDKPYVSPEQWYEQHKSRNGSWWAAWHRWLASHSKKKSAPPKMGAPEKGYKILDRAPGSYVKER